MGIFDTIQQMAQGQRSPQTHTDESGQRWEHRGNQGWIKVGSPTTGSASSATYSSPEDLYFDDGAGAGQDTGTYDLLEGYMSTYNTEIDNYVNELKEMAQGDYDFASKWIESEYKLALGTNDAERTKFLKEVANELERDVGTIAYDYKTGKYRTEQDKELALTRLAEDEQTYRGEMERESAEARERAGEGLSERGLITGKYGETRGLGGKTVRDLEQRIGEKQSALERGLARGRFDIEQKATRGLENITTEARRGAQTSTDLRISNLEKQKRALEKSRKEAEAYGATSKRTLAGGLSSYI